MAGARSFVTRELVVVDDCRLLEPGHWALLWFDGDDVWHQRLLLWPSRRDKSRFVCVTPDEEIYEEPFLEVDPLNHSIASYGLDGRLSRPSGLRHDVYGFDEEPSKDDILGWLDWSCRGAEAFGRGWRDSSC